MGTSVEGVGVCDPRLNSGVQIRSHVDRNDEPKPENRKPAGVVYGPQCEIARKYSGMCGPSGPTVRHNL